MRRLLRSLSKFGIESKSEEDKDCPEPLHSADDVSKQQHRTQDGEEFPSRRDDGTGERSEIHHSHKDEGLSKSAGQTKQEDIIDDVRIAFCKCQKIPHFTCPEHSFGEERDKTFQAKVISRVQVIFCHIGFEKICWA